MSAEGSFLDAAATAPLRERARAAMAAVLDGGQANASSVHAPGHRARRFVEDARNEIARALGARPSDVVFTSGGTEANNLAVIGLSLANPRGRHLVTTPIEHPSVLESCRFLERVHGYELTMVPVDGDGRVDPADVAAVLRPDTTLVSVGLANAEVGTVQPIVEIGAIVRASGALMHTDAVQAAASLPLSFARSSAAAFAEASAGTGTGTCAGAERGVGADRGAGVGPAPGGVRGGEHAVERAPAWPGEHVDALTIASHKFGGPQGAGALLVRRNLAIEPILHGGGQEGGARSGTENVAAIAGFAAAVVEATAAVGARALETLASRDELVRSVLAEVTGARLTGAPDERLPGHASFVVAGVSGESLLVALDAAGFAVSSGSACAAGRDAPSPVLLAMGMSSELAQTAIRFTLPGPVDSGRIERIVGVLRATAGGAGRSRGGTSSRSAAPIMPPRHSVA